MTRICIGDEYGLKLMKRVTKVGFGTIEKASRYISKWIEWRGFEMNMKVSKKSSE